MGNSQGTPTAEQKHSWKEADADSRHGHVEYATLDELLKNVRSERVLEEFHKLPESRYTDINEIRILASTFNLNGRKPPKNLSLDEYVKYWESSWPMRSDDDVIGGLEKADIYLMGFQESVPLNAQNIIAGWTTVPAGWDVAIDKTLNPWKSAEEIMKASTPDESDASLIDFYEFGWSGVPSGNLESRIRPSLSETSSRKRLSYDETYVRKTEERRSRPTKSDLTDDLISFEPFPLKQPVAKNNDSVDKEAVKREETVHNSAGEDQSKNEKIEKEENPNSEFIQLFRHQLVGLYVSGWVRKSLLKRITGVQVTTVATGALGYLANKGAIAVRFRVDDSAVVFVTSHLASGSSEGDQIKRNLDFSEIVRRTQFPREVSLVKVMWEDGTVVEDFSARPEGIPENATYEIRRAYVGGKWGMVRRLRELDNIIWVGDLNYRINAKAATVIPLIRADKLNQLLEIDQLNIEKYAGHVFQDFVEAPIDFPPTYKFVRGTGYYTGEVSEGSSSDSDDAGGEKAMNSLSDISTAVMSHQISDTMLLSSSDSSRRTLEARESLTDRHHSAFVSSRPSKTQFSAVSENEHTLQRRGSTGDITVAPKKDEKPKKPPKKIRTPAWTDRILWHSSTKQLHQLLYGSFSSVTVSDHRPVVSTFLMETRKFDHHKVDDALQAARRNIDVEDMASIPRCKLVPTAIEVVNVSYGRPVDHTITLQNIGEVQASFSFIPPNLGPLQRSPFPKWLTAAPESGIVRPGKKEHIKLRISIEGGQTGSADELYDDLHTTLDHILVLHVEGGSDFFVSIIGSFTLSCFGISLNNLAMRLPPNQDKLTTTQTMGSAKLPSLRYRERRRPGSMWEIPVMDENTSSIEQLQGLPQPSQTPSFRLQKSASLAATGAKPNLMEGPTGLMIPGEVSRMLYFLASEGRLKTPNLFVDSFRLLSKSTEKSSTIPSIVMVRDALDNATGFHFNTTAHDMATALLVFFMDLPSPLIPESVAQSCEMSDISALMAMSLVKEAMSAVEWSVFDSTLELMRSARMDENATKNQVTEEALVNVLAHIFFQDVPKNPGLKRTAIHLKELASATSTKKAMIESRRCAFIRQFLRLDKPLIDLSEVTPSEIIYLSS